MKKILLGVLVLGVLVGCGEKNEEYYFQNLDKAKEKVASCKEEAGNAFKNRDDKAFDKVRNNPECNAASDALQKQRQIEYEKKVQAQELERKLAAEKRESEIAEFKNKLIEEHKEQPWQDKLTSALKFECQREFFAEPGVDCVAWESFHEDAINEGLKTLEASSFDDVVAKEAEFCSRDKRRGSACTVWQKSLEQKTTALVSELNLFDLEAQKAQFCDNRSFPREVCQAWSNRWDEQSKLLVKVFMDDFDVFKDTYNACVTDIATIKSQKLGWSKEHDAISAITRSAPCYQARDAYSQRGLGYSEFDKTIE